MRSLSVVVLLALAAPAAHSQGPGPLSEYGGSPQAWRPAQVSEPGVDARGDLNLDLPILTVPGRNGLDFDVRFRYTSGIRFDQPSGWIGGGWSFDPGSITRDVFGIVLDGVTHNVDFTRPPAEQPDQYHITLPGASTAMVRADNIGGRPPGVGQNEFAATSFRDWKIEATTSDEGVAVNTPLIVDGIPTAYHGGGTGAAQARADYSRFVITDEAGLRYVFGHPTLSTYKGMGLGGTYTREHYASMWRLEAILGHDYQGDAVPNPEGGRDGEAGSWVHFEYTDVMTKCLPTAACGNEGVPTTAQVYQTSYLTRIRTPTHSAFFETAPAARENHPAWQDGAHRKLTRVRLIARGADRLASHLVQEIRVSQSAVFDSPARGNPTPRSALTSINYYGSDGPSGGLLSQYAFTYFGRLGDGGGDPLTPDHVDHFGYYDTAGDYDGDFNADADDGASWSLESITYPTGGVDRITYENDSASGGAPYGELESGMNQPAARSYSVRLTLGPTNDGRGQGRQGGARVVSIERDDALGDTPSATTTYRYPRAGRLSGVPPGHWNEYNSSRPFVFATNRGRSAVYYDRVVRVNPDGSEVATEYSAVHSSLRPVEQVETVAWVAGSAAFTLFQGNQDIFWGKPVRREFEDASGTVVRRETTDWNLPLTGQIWNVYGYRVLMNWVFADRVTRRTVWDHGEGTAGVSTQTVYEYFDGGPVGERANHLVRRETVERSDGRKREVSYRYGHEVYDELNDAHRVGHVVQQTVTEVAADGSREVVASQATTFGPFQAQYDDRIPPAPGQGGFVGSITVDLFKPHRTYELAVTDGPPEVAFDFSNWTQGTPPAAWERTSTTESYDGAGLPTAVTDARGETTTLENDWFGRLTRVRAPSAGGIVLERAFGYDRERGRLISVMDENGRTSTYTYDTFGRHTAVRNPAGDLVATFGYDTDAVPHAVTTTRHGGPTANGLATPNTVSKAFFDGLGRPVQTQDLITGSTWSVAASRYLPGGNGQPASERAYRPFPASTGGAYEAGYHAAATAHYGSGTQPYALTEYLRDGTGRVGRALGPQPAGASLPGGAGTRRYGVAFINQASERYRYADATDEDGRRTRVLTDDWGQAFRTVHAFGSPLEAITQTEYDAAGRALVLRPPNAFAPPSGSTAEDWVTTSTYDTRGRLLEQVTPDAGRTRYRYDRAGALRYSQDADQAAGGRVAFTTYDALGRPLLAGEHPVSFASLTDPDATQPWEVAGNAHTLHTYDAKPSTSGPTYAPFAQHVGQANADNPLGRLVATLSLAEDGVRQLEVSGYSDDGYLDRRETFTTQTDDPSAVANLYTSRFQLGRDRQGRITTRTTQVGTIGARTFSHWYRYDGRGLVDRIWSDPSATRPNAPDVRYTYDAARAVASQQYRNRTAVPYTYDVKGRLTDIGGDGWDPNDVNGRPFTAHYAYSNAGNVTEARFGYNASGTGPGTGAGQRTYFRTRYGYDARSRLLSADYDEGGETGTWATTTAYDVGALAYDPNGNLLRMTRNGPDGALVDNLTYVYGDPLTPGSSNRLTALQDAAGGGTWDAASGALTYDRRSNPTTLPAPYYASAITYDWRNRPTAVTAGDQGQTAAAYRYSASGQQYRRAVTTSPSIGVGGRREASPGDPVLDVPPSSDSPVRGTLPSLGVPERIERPDAERPGVERPGVERPQAEPPGVERPGAERPGAERPRFERGGPVRRDTVTARGGDARASTSPSVSGAPSASAAPSPDPSSPPAPSRSPFAARPGSDPAPTATPTGPVLGEAAPGARPVDGTRVLGEPRPEGATTDSRSPWAQRPEADARPEAAPGRATLGEATPRPSAVPSLDAPSPDATSAAPGARLSPDAPRAMPGRVAPVAGTPSGSTGGTTSSDAGATLAVDFLILDPTLHGRLQPVAGTIRTTTLGAETQSSADVTFHLLAPSGEVLGRALPDGGRRYYHKDLLGSTRAVVTETGALAEQAAYDAWGVRLRGRLTAGLDAGGSTDEGFTGKTRLDGLGGRSAGLDDFGARTYAPAYGRFLQVDPLTSKMPSWGPYTYAFDNPIAFIDPDGMAPEDCCKRLRAAARSANAFVAGVTASVADNTVPGTRIRESIGSNYAGNARAFNRGQDLGDAVSVVLGSAEIFGGVTTATGGAAVTVSTGGIGGVVGVPAGAAGAAVSAHGTIVVGSGARNLIQQNGRLNTSSTPSPFLRDSPYSPESVSRRQSDRRRQVGLPADPDIPLPNRGPGRDLGGHQSTRRPRHTTGERNVASREEHSRVPKGNRGH